MTCRAYPIAIGFLLLVASEPAWADHPVVSAGASNGSPIVTIAADTLPQGTLAGGLQVSYVKPDSYSDAELIALASEHVHAHTTDYNLLATASLAYGVTNHFTLSASLPYLHRDNLRAGEHSHSSGAASNIAEELGSVSGVGDLTILGQYQLAHSHDKGWGLALIGGIKVPTGATHRHSHEGERLETEHQPGTGSWDPLLGFAASKRWGPVSLDGNLLYQFSTNGVQQTELGDRLSLNAAISYSLSEGEAHHDHDTGDHGHNRWTLVLEANGEWEGRQRVEGEIETDSGSKVVYMSPGIKYGSPAGWSAAVSAGFPIWQEVRASHPDNSFRLIMQIGSSF